MNLTINNSKMWLPEGTTVEKLFGKNASMKLRYLKINDKEINRDDYGTTVLHDGDCIKTKRLSGEYEAFSYELYRLQKAKLEDPELKGETAREVQFYGTPEEDDDDSWMYAAKKEKEAEKDFPLWQSHSGKSREALELEELEEEKAAWEQYGCTRYCRCCPFPGLKCIYDVRKAKAASH